MTNRHKEVFDVVFDGMPWLYPVFFEQPLHEHDLATFLTLVSGFLSKKLDAQRDRISQAFQDLFKRAQDRQRLIQTEAYLLWESAGKPEGDGKEFWRKAEQEFDRTLENDCHEISKR